MILKRANAWIEKWIAFVTPTCLLLGVLFPEIAGRGVAYVPVVFAFMTFTGALKSSFKDIGAVLRKPLPLLLILAVLHVVMPCAAWSVGEMFFAGNRELITGMVLEFSVPAAVVGMMWVSIYKGDSSITLSLLVIDTVLAPLIIPLTLNDSCRCQGKDESGRNDERSGLYDRTAGTSGNVLKPVQLWKSERKMAGKAGILVKAVPDILCDL